MLKGALFLIFFYMLAIFITNLLLGFNRGPTVKEMFSDVIYESCRGSVSSASLIVFGTIENAYQDVSTESVVILPSRVVLNTLTHNRIALGQRLLAGTSKLPQEQRITLRSSLNACFFLLKCKNIDNAIVFDLFQLHPPEFEDSILKVIKEMSLKPN